MTRPKLSKMGLVYSDDETIDLIAAQLMADLRGLGYFISPVKARLMTAGVMGAMSKVHSGAWHIIVPDITAEDSQKGG